MLALRIATSLGSLLLGCTLLTACNNPKTTGSTQATGEDSLPAPAAQGGSVTGMPDPGVARARPAPVEVIATETSALPEEGDAMTAASTDGTDPQLPPEPLPQALAEPAAQAQAPAPVAAPAPDPGTPPPADPRR